MKQSPKTGEKAPARHQPAPDAIYPRPPATQSAQELARPVREVQDPEDPRKKRLAAVDTRIDILESEFAYGRISQGAFEIGRAIQSVLERPVRLSMLPTRVRDRGQTAYSINDRIARGIGAAESSIALLNVMEEEIGPESARIIRAVVTSPSLTGPFQVPTSGQATLFRRGLEELASRFVIRGS